MKIKSLSLSIALIFITLINIQAQKNWDSKYLGPIDHITQTLDNKFIVCGVVNHFISEWNVMQLDSVGKMQPSQILQDNDLNYFSYGGFSCIKATLDSGYLIVGFMSGGGEEHSEILKFDKFNKLQWKREYPAIRVNDVIVEKDGYLFTWTYHDIDYLHQSQYFLKTNLNGDSIWQKNYEYPLNDNFSIKKSKDGGYFYFSSNMLLKIDSKGDILWSKQVIGQNDIGESMDLTSDNGLIIAGQSDNNFLFTKLDENSNEIWSKRFATKGYLQLGYCKKIVSTFDKGFISTFQLYDRYTSTYQAFIIKTDLKGDTLWTINNPYEQDVLDIIQCKDSAYAMVCEYNLVAKFDSIGKARLTVSVPSIETGEITFENYPNPFRTETTIKWNINKNSKGHSVLKVRNIQGVLLLERNIEQKGELLFSTEGMAGGLFICEIESQNKHYFRKMIRLTH